MTKDDETERSQHSDDLPDDRPLPGPGTRDGDAAADKSGDAESDGDKGDAEGSGDKGDGDKGDADADADKGDGDQPEGPDAEPVYNDRDKLDFDPDEGFYTGTAVTGDTEIPGEHERVDDVPVEEDDSDGDDAGDSGDDDSDDDSA